MRQGRGFENDNDGLSLDNVFVVGAFARCGRTWVMTWIEPRENIDIEEELFSRMSDVYDKNIQPLMSGALTSRYFACTNRNGYDAGLFPGIVQQTFRKLCLREKWRLADFDTATIWNRDLPVPRSYGTVEALIRGPTHYPVVIGLACAAE